MRHPGHARGDDHARGEGVGEYEIWISDGDIVRTYSSRHKLGTQRPIRNKPRGLDDPDIPGASRVYEPLTALPTETLPETFIHPAGYCQNVLSTGECQVTGPEVIGGRETIGLTCQHPRTTELPPTGLTTHPDRGRSRHRDHRAPHPVDGRRDHQGRRGRRPGPRCGPPADGLRLRLPDGDDDALLTAQPVRPGAAPGRSRGSRRSTRRCRQRSPGRR